MRTLIPLAWLLAALGWPWLACAQLQLLPDTASQAVFAAGTRTINVTWRNLGESTISMPIRMQLYQASSSTAAPLGGPQEWKSLQVLPRQTVLDQAAVTLPAVKAKTRWVIQWLDESNQVLGHTDLMVYPTNLLRELKLPASEAPIGLFDPQNRLKPLLKSSGLEFEDLEAGSLKQCPGRLVIIAQFDAKASNPEWLAGSIAEMAKTGLAVVWIKPPPDLFPQPEPAINTIPLGRGAISVIQARVVFDLRGNPVSQLNLIRAAELAARPG